GAENMREHIAPFVYYLEVHVLYASVLCMAAWALTAVRGTSATWKYWVWVATLVNFVVPIGGFFNAFGASQVPWASQLAGLDDVGIGISRNLTVGTVLLAAWLLGAMFMFARLLLRLRNDRRNERAACGRTTVVTKALPLAHGVPVTLSAGGEG